jgi:hypothetical protein
MEKDIGKIKKNDDTDIVVRIDDFGGKKGLTIREFVHSDRYTGFTKAGVRIRAEEFENFKEMINSVNPKELQDQESVQRKIPETNSEEEYSGVGEDGFM